MNNKLNLTSLILGAIIGALAVFTMGAANSSSTQTNASGRFQLLASDGMIFKIDSRTGQVWRSYVSGDIKSFCNPVVAE
jgi:hypothetical protein